MRTLHIDFETRSAADLDEVGVDAYAHHPTTQPWCLGYAMDNDEPAIVTAEDFPVFCPPLFNTIAVAHNAPFELAIWNAIMRPRYGWPRLDIANVHCTMVQGYAMALPGALEKMRAALGILLEKDDYGRRLSLQMSRPRTEEPCVWCGGSGHACEACCGTGTLYTWWDEPDKLARLYAYCLQDVRIEREIHKRTLPLSAAEHQLWTVDYAINQTGVYVDQPSINAALAVVSLEQGRLERELSTLTGGDITSPNQAVALTDWVNRRGVGCPSLQKTDVLDILSQHDLPADVRRALEIRQEYGRTSVAKLRKMRDTASPDGYLKHILQFHAASTGRWGGRRIQPQNLPRPKLKHKEIDAILEFLPRLTPEQSIERMDLLYGAPMNCISDCLRGVICAAPGHRLYAGDFANIEGRALCWLAGEEWKLDAFKAYDNKTGPDLYVLAAARIYHVAPSTLSKESPQRQIGKVSELACGYQGGVGAFQTMAYTYGVRVPDAEADAIKTAWRESNPCIVNYWYDLERAAMEAVLTPGLVCPAGPGARIKFKVSGSFLWCLLPSGRALCYPYPRIASRMMPWGDEKDALHYKCVDDRTKQWIETHTYGGKLAENVTSAVCRDLLAHSIQTLHYAEWKIVLHVHDEIVAEIAEGSTTVNTLQLFLSHMRNSPRWAAGLPVTVAGWEGRRYRK